MTYCTAQWPNGGENLEPELYDSRKHDDAVAAEVEQLMTKGSEYDPWTPANFAEALGEIAAGMGEDINRAAWQYGTGNVCMGGATLNYAIIGYWRRKATEHAESLVGLQARERRQCDPDEGR